MNKVILIGRLTREPVIRYTEGPEQNAVIRFTLAVDRRFRRDNDQNADFISCVAFGVKAAEWYEKYVRQGTKLTIEGRIQTGSFEKNGQKIYTTNVVVENAEFTESKKSSENKNTEGGSGANEGFMDVPEENLNGVPFT